MDPLKRMFLVGLTVPFAAAGVAALAVRPDSLLQWLAVVATVPIVSGVVAMAYAWRSRAEPLEVRHPTTRERLRGSRR